MVAVMGVARHDRKPLPQHCLGARRPAEPAARRSGLQCFRRKRITHALICGPYGQVFGTEKECLQYFTAWVRTTGSRLHLGSTGRCLQICSTRQSRQPPIQSLTTGRPLHWESDWRKPPAGLHARRRPFEVCSVGCSGEPDGVCATAAAGQVNARNGGRAEENGPTARETGFRDGLIRLDCKLPLRTPCSHETHEANSHIARIPWLISHQSTSRRSADGRSRATMVVALSIRRKRPWLDLNI